MRVFSIFRKNKTVGKPGKFSDFFLHASEKEKERVFKEAAYRANEEQREVFKRAHLKVKAN